MKENILFAMQNITIDQFAILGDKIPTDGHVTTEIEIGMDKENCGVAIRFRITYLTADDTTVLVIQVTCIFAIKEEDWKTFVLEDGKVSIPHDLLAHFAMHTFGTMRGILYCKTVDSPLGAVILPPTNVDKLVPEEFVM